MHSRRHFAVRRALRISAVLAVMALALPAQTITIGGVAIADGGPRDLDPAAQVIRFDSTAGGWAPPAGASVSTLSGTVRSVGGPALAHIVLTDFRATRLAGAGAGALVIRFQDRFAAPPAPAVGQDRIDGSFTNTIAPFFVGAGTHLTWQGFVNGGPIAGGPAAVIGNPVAPAPAPVAILGNHGPDPVGGGPPWVLRGDLTITLAAIGDRVNLPGSAKVWVRGEPAGTRGTPGWNDFTIDGQGSGTASCTRILVPAGGVSEFRVETIDLGMPVFLYVSSCPCAPRTRLLPPANAPIPPVPGTATNQSLDLAISGPCRPVLLASGVTTPQVSGGRLVGEHRLPLLIPPALQGHSFSMQGLVLEPASGAYLLTQAYDVEVR